MRVVISYSKAHFSPDRKSKFVDSSAGFIAQNLYEAACAEFGTSHVQYFDHTEFGKVRTKAGAGPIVFLGINANFASWVNNLKPDVSTLISVNAAPSYRKQNIHRLLDMYNLSQKFVSGGDSFGESSTPLAIADRHLILGDFANIQTFMREGLNPKDIYPIRFQRAACQDLHSTESRFVLLPIGEICIRKGFLDIQKIMEAVSRAGLRLMIVGRIENKHIGRKIRKLKSIYGSQLKHLAEHIPKCTPEWHEVFGQSLFSIFPSTEEGLPDMVFDSIKHGVPVFYTAESGFPSHVSMPLDALAKRDWAKVVDHALQSDLVGLANLQSRALLSESKDQLNSKELISFATKNAHFPSPLGFLDSEPIEQFTGYRKVAWPSIPSASSDENHEQVKTDTKYVYFSGYAFRTSV